MTAAVETGVDLKLRLHRTLIDTLGPKLYNPAMDQAELDQIVRNTVARLLQAEGVTDEVRAQISQEMADEVLGHGPIEPFLRDPAVTEIMVNGANQIFVERLGKLYQVETAFTDNDHVRRVIEKIVARVGRRIDESSPMVDARLADGSRINAVVAPVALDGPTLTVRKFSADPFTADDLIDFGTLTPAVTEFLEACVRGKLNVLISGGTGSGKTTTLNVISGFVPDGERIVTIEDAAELKLRQSHVLRMESRPANIEGKGAITIRDLVKNSLRMRPDRIVVGEVRDGAALDMLQAMNTGHEGSLTTVHANSPRDALARLETMVLMAGLDLPVRAIREQTSSAIDLIIQQARLRDGTRRVVAVTEVIGMEGDVITLQDIFSFDWHAGRDPEGKFLGKLRPTGLRPGFVQKLEDNGVKIPTGMFFDHLGVAR